VRRTVVGELDHSRLGGDIDIGPEATAGVLEAFVQSLSIENAVTRSIICSDCGGERRWELGEDEGLGVEPPQGRQSPFG
jgi:hypothetical protein